MDEYTKQILQEYPDYKEYLNEVNTLGIIECITIKVLIRGNPPDTQKKMDIHNP